VSFEIPETGHGRDGNVHIRLEPGDDSKRSAIVAICFRHASRTLNLVDVAINDDHLAIEIGKRTEAKISVFENCLNAYLAIVYPRDEGARGRDLKNRVDRFLKISSEGCDDDG
jgi:hypothetical protein